jgi:hypothetical protein
MIFVWVLEISGSGKANRMATFTFTPEQEEVATDAALAIAVLPKGERRLQMFNQILRSYIKLACEQWPDLTDEQIATNAFKFGVAIFDRVSDIDFSTGGSPAGSA